MFFATWPGGTWCEFPLRGSFFGQLCCYTAFQIGSWGKWDINKLNWSIHLKFHRDFSTLCHGWPRTDRADLCQQDALLEPAIQAWKSKFCSTILAGRSSYIHDVYQYFWIDLHDSSFSQYLCWEAWAQTEGCIHRCLAAYVIRRYNKTRNSRPDAHLFQWSNR